MVGLRKKRGREYDSSDFTNNEDDTCGPKGIAVLATTNWNQIRKWDKKQSCIFCGKLLNKLPRHFEQVHLREPEVQKLLALPKNSGTRHQLLNKLRGAGNYVHNSKVMENKCGTIIPQRRVAIPPSPSKLVPCPHCQNFFLRLRLSRHVRKCPSLKSPSTLHRTNVLKPALHLLPLVDADKYQHMLNTYIIDGMSEKDATYNKIVSDEIVIQYGTELIERHEGKSHLRNFIRNKLREIGRFLIEVEKIDPSIKSLKDIYQPVHFEKAVEATKNVAKFDVRTGKFEIPNLAKKIGETLKICAMIALKNAIRTKGPREEIEDFMSLYKEDWNRKITSKVQTTIYESKFNREPEIPDPEDMVILNSHINSESEIALQDLDIRQDSSTYARLCRVALASVIVFNRKRAGDAQHIKLESYLKKNAGEIHPRVFDSLPPNEQKLVAMFSRFETVGKHGKKVPVLLTEKIEKMMDLLLKHRYRCGVLRENPYFFAVPGTIESCYRGSDVIRHLRCQVPLKHPERITTITMRKEAATLAAACGITESQVDQLATFLGHSSTTHKEFYRLPESTYQTAKISQFLMDINSGEILTARNKEVVASKSDNLVGHQGPSTTRMQKKNEKSRRQLWSDDDSDEEYEPVKKFKKTKGIVSKWTEEQKATIKLEMRNLIALRKVPGKDKCTQCLLKHKCLSQKRWIDIKNYVKNLVYPLRNVN